MIGNGKINTVMINIVNIHELDSLRERCVGKISNKNPLHCDVHVI